MLVKLRDYQARSVQGTREYLRQGIRRVLLQLPTGGGKTAIASHITGETAAAGRLVYFVCHRAELVEQTSLTFRKFGIPHGIIAAGFPTDRTQLVQVCSIDTLKTRLGGIPMPWLVIVDEAHHCCARGWGVVINAFANAGARILGLSATPKRLDGKGMDEHFQAMVLGPTLRELIDAGHLADYRFFRPPQMDDKDLAKPQLVGDAVAHWRKYAAGMRSVAFARDVAHSLSVVEEFRGAGIPAAHLDGTTPKGERRQIIRDYADGKLMVLSNVDLFGEGFDLSAIAQTDVTIDCALLLRRTQSLSLYLQWVGRALRPAPGKRAVILDHAGNWYLHDDPDAERDWNLTGDSGGKKPADPSKPPPTTCPQCWEQHPFPWPDKCPCCGHALRKPPEIKPVAVIAGELEETTEEDSRLMREQRAREEAEAKTLQDFVNLAHRRGYAKPQQWAFKRWTARRGKSVAA